jgi:hypothetical protein
MVRACSTNRWKRNVYGILGGKPEGKGPLGRQDVSGWIIIKWNIDRMRWYGLMWLRIGTSGTR